MTFSRARFKYRLHFHYVCLCFLPHQIIQRNGRKLNFGALLYMFNRFQKSEKRKKLPVYIQAAKTKGKMHIQMSTHSVAHKISQLNEKNRATVKKIKT